MTSARHWFLAAVRGRATLLLLHYVSLGAAFFQIRFHSKYYGRREQQLRKLPDLLQCMQRPPMILPGKVKRVWPNSMCSSDGGHDGWLKVF